MNKGLSNRKTIFAKFFLVLTLACLVYVAIALGRQTYRKYKIEKEVSSLEQEISETRQDNLKLSELFEYFQKESFKEREARAKLNFKKPGEKVIILTPSDEEPITEENQLEEKEASNAGGWWDYFFKKP